MVDFNRLQPTNDPSYSGSSQAPSRFDFRNEAMGTLFSGIGDNVEKTAAAADNVVQEKIKEEAYGRVDPIRDSSGNNTAVDAYEQGKGPLNLDQGGKPLSANKPPDPSSFSDRIARLQAARDAGKITPTYYYTQLESESRALRSRFPGYREQVDQTIQQITGVVPANALRASIQSDLDTAKSQSDAAAQRWETFEHNNAANLPSDYYQRKAQGRPYGKMETEEFVRQRQAEDSGISRERSRIALANDRQQLSVNDAESTATKELNTYTTRMLNSATDAAGGGMALQQKVLSIWKSGGNVTPEQTQQMTAQFATLQAAHSAMIDKTLNSPFGPNGESYASILGPEKTKRLREASIAQLDSVRQMLVDKDFGALLINQNAQKAMQDSDARAILEKYPMIRNLSVLSAQPGMKEYIAAQIARGDASLSNTMDSVRRVLETNRQANGSNAMADMKTVADFQKAKGGGNGGRAYFNGLVEDLQNPAAPKSVTQNSARSVFNEQNKYFLQMFKPEERMDVFTRLVSPEVTKRIQSLGDKETWDNYSTWSKNAFFNVFKQAGDDIKDSVNREWFDVKFNDKSNQYEVVPTPAGVAMAAKDSRSAGMNPLNFLERQYSGNLQSQVDKINRGLKAIEPILKADGYEPGQEMGKLLRDKRLVPEGKEDTFFGKLRRGIDNVIGDPWGKSGTPDTNTFGGSNINFTNPQGQGFGVLTLGDSERMKSRPGISLGGVSPSLIQALDKASAFLPEGYTAKAISGMRHGDPRQHGQGTALDVQIYDPQGNPVPNYQNAESFRLYEKFAQGVKQVADRDHPDIKDTLRWGGYFGGPKGKYGALDLMHFDVGGGHMAGGSWAEGLHPGQRSLWPGVDSQGMASRPARGAVENAATMKPNTPEGFYVPVASDLNGGQGRPSDFHGEDSGGPIKTYEDLPPDWQSPGKTIITDEPRNKERVDKLLKEGWEIIKVPSGSKAPDLLWMRPPKNPDALTS